MENCQEERSEARKAGLKQPWLSLAEGRPRGPDTWGRAGDEEPDQISRAGSLEKIADFAKTEQDKGAQRRLNVRA